MYVQTNSPGFLFAWVTVDPVVSGRAKGLELAVSWARSAVRGVVLGRFAGPKRTVHKYISSLSPLISHFTHSLISHQHFHIEFAFSLRISRSCQSRRWHRQTRAHREYSRDTTEQACGRDSFDEAFVRDLLSPNQPGTFTHPNRHAHRLELNRIILIFFVNVCLQGQDPPTEAGAVLHRSSQSCLQHVRILRQPSGLTSSHLVKSWPRTANIDARRRV
jgi:hypothetical protein